MNKPALTGIFLAFFLFSQASQAQTSINRINGEGNGESSMPVFINGISFTPDGILKNPESGGTKSIKTVPAPVVTVSHEAAQPDIPEVIETASPLQFKYAMMMDVDVESLKNLSLLGFMDEWFGIRYRYGGHTKKGIDCSALTGALLLAVYGFKMPRTAREQYDATEHLQRDELKEGDLVFFNTRGGVSHVGIYLKNNYFFHASLHGVTISSLEDPYYSRKFICGGRVQEPAVAAE